MLIGLGTRDYCNFLEREIADAQVLLETFSLATEDGVRSFFETEDFICVAKRELLSASSQTSKD